MAKRPAEDDGGAPSSKRPSLLVTPLDIGPATGQDDLDIKVLQVQNRKLSERLRERNRRQQQMESELQKSEDLRLVHLRVVCGLGRRMSLLHEHLGLLFTTFGAEMESEGVREDLVRGLAGREEEAGEEELERLFESVLRTVRVLQEKGQEAMVAGLKEAGDTAGDKLQSLERRYSALLSRQASGGQNDDETTRLQDELTALEARCEELETTLDNVRYDLHRSQIQSDRLEARLTSSLEQLRTGPGASPLAMSEKGPAPFSLAGGAVQPAPETTEQPATVTEESEPVQSELAECQALAESRLREAEELSSQLSECRKEFDSVRLQGQSISDSTVKDSTPYKMLQMQYSIVCTECSQLRMYVEEMRRMLTSAKQHHFVQLQEIRQEETKYQMEVRGEMVAMETTLAAAKRDYQLLRIDYEKTLASNEQAAPIAKELQVMVDSLQKTIQQLKAEVGRYKGRAHKAEQQLAKDEKDAGGQISSEVKDPLQKSTTGEGVEGGGGGAEGGDGKVAELQAKMSSLQEEKRVLEKEVEGWRSVDKEEREKGELVAAEKRARAQVDEMRRRFEEMRKDYEKRKEHLKEEAVRKNRSLTEDNRHLQRELSAKKQEAQALMSDMECTAQAFEEMQEQNIRLLQQLKEKDDANFKLMSERIKANNLQKLLLEEKQLLQSQIDSLSSEQARLNETINQMDEREHSSDTTIASLEKELSLRQQVMEMHKKKALESVQSLQETRLKFSDVEGQVEEARKAMQSKADECERETQQLRRAQEEVSSLKRKLEKYKTREWAASGDEVLLEEIKTYKAKLNCPCCSTRKKDTVLTKCFHVFCSECIRNRYDSRLRKCPKCGAAFGANDFHKIYLS